MVRSFPTVFEKRTRNNMKHNTFQKAENDKNTHSWTFWHNVRSETTKVLVSQKVPELFWAQKKVWTVQLILSWKKSLLEKTKADECDFDLFWWHFEPGKSTNVLWLILTGFLSFVGYNLRIRNPMVTPVIRITANWKRKNVLGKMSWNQLFFIQSDKELSEVKWLKDQRSTCGIVHFVIALSILLFLSLSLSPLCSMPATPIHFPYFREMLCFQLHVDYGDTANQEVAVVNSYVYVHSHQTPMWIRVHLR